MPNTNYKPIFVIRASDVLRKHPYTFPKFGEDVSLGDVLVFPKYEDLDLRVVHNDRFPESPYKYYINIYKSGKPYWLLLAIKSWNDECKQWGMFNRLGRLLDEYSITEREKWNSPMKTLEKFYGNTIVL